MTNEGQQHEVHAEDLTLYALGALEATELARVRKHLESCASCRLELQKLNADMGALAMATAPESMPPSRVKDRLMKETDREAAGAKRAWNWSWAFRMALALILLVAVIFQWRNTRVLEARNQQLLHELDRERTESAQARAIAELMKDPGAMRITLMSTNSHPQPMAHVICTPKNGRVLLMAHDLEPLGPGKMYELWLLPMSGKPVPAGMFNSDAKWTAEMYHSGMPEYVEAKGFAITIEPAEGSAAPTSAPILMGNSQS